MIKFIKLNRLKNKSGQALLLVMIVSMVSLAVVVGIFDRTNKQLNVQRQNSEYKLAFDRVLGATDALQALINSNSITDPYDSVAINDAFRTANLIPCTDPVAGSTSSVCDYKITVDPFNPTTYKPITLNSDDSLFITQYDKTATKLVKSFTFWCDTDPANSSVVIQPIYQNGGNYGMDSLAADCKTALSSDTTNSTSGAINGGNVWSVKNKINTICLPAPNNYCFYSNGSDALPNPNKGGASTSYLKITYNVPASKQNIVGIRVIPKTGYGYTSSASALPNYLSSFVLGMYDGNDAGGKIIGTSNPLTGTAIGYAKNGRTATVKFNIQNNLKMSPFFNYVAYEGR